MPCPQRTPCPGWTPLPTMCRTTSTSELSSLSKSQHSSAARMQNPMHVLWNKVHWFSHYSGQWTDTLLDIKTAQPKNHQRLRFVWNVIKDSSSLNWHLGTVNSVIYYSSVLLMSRGFPMRCPEALDWRSCWDVSLRPIPRASAATVA